MDCHLLADLRKEMWDQLDWRGIKHHDYDQLVSEPKAARHVANYMLKTGLLGQFKAVEPPQEDPENSGPSNTGIG